MANAPAHDLPLPHLSRKTEGIGPLTSWQPSRKNFISIIDKKRKVPLPILRKFFFEKDKRIIFSARFLNRYKTKAI